MPDIRNIVDEANAITQANPDQFPPSSWKSFNQARAEAEALMRGEEPAEESAAEEPASTEQPAEEPAPTEQAAEQAAEQPTPQPEPQPEPQNAPVTPQEPTQPQGAMQATMDMAMELRRLQAENQQLRAAQEEQSRQVREGAMNAAQASPDINYANLAEQIAYGSDEERQGALEALVSRAGEMGYARAMQELKPIREQYENAIKEQEYDAALGQFEGLPGMSGISGMKDDLRRIGDKFFSGLSPSDQIARARIYKMGLDAMNNPPEERQFTRDDAMAMYRSDPELRRLIEADRYNAAKAAQTQEAPVLPSAGYGNAAPTMPNVPQSLDDAKALAKEYMRR